MATVHLMLVAAENEFLSRTEAQLERYGAEIFTAANNADALDILDKHRVDVVVLDVNMPESGGMEVLRDIKKKMPLVEVVLLAGHTAIKTAVEGLRLGAFDYVAKPCDLPELLEKIEAAHAKKEAMEEKIRKARVERIISHPMAVFDDDQSAP